MTVRLFGRMARLRGGRVALGQHPSKGRLRGSTLTAELADLEGGARLRRARDENPYSRLLLSETSGVPEAKFAPWLAGEAASGDDDDDLMAVVSTLALWAGKPRPEQGHWLSLAAAAREHRAAGALPKLRALLPRSAAWTASLVSALIVGIVAPIVVIEVTSGPGTQPTSGAGVPAVPFSYPVSRTNGSLGGCAGWLFPQSIQKIPYTSLHGSQDAAADETWALRHGAADVDGGAYTIILQGDSATDNVVIMDVRIKILSRKPAQAGTVIYNQSGCGSALAVQDFTVQVDSPDPQFTAQNGAARWPYTISSTDEEDLILNASISPSDRDVYQFVYQIDWSQGSRQRTVTVTAPDGKPFTAAPLLPGSSGYYSGNGHWAS